MKKIKYKVNAEETESLTPCPYGINMNVGDDSCVLDCKYNIRDNDKKHFILCDKDEDVENAEWHKLINRVCNWADEEKEIKKWPEFEKEYLQRWGWNDKAIDSWQDWGVNGFNNERLHASLATEHEFFSEVGYCSDRMSIDRLFRCRFLWCVCMFTKSFEHKSTVEYLQEYYGSKVGCVE